MPQKKTFVSWAFWLSFLLLVGCTPTAKVTIGSPVPTETPKESTISASITPEPTKNEPVKQPIQEVKGEVKVHFIDVGQGASQLIIGPTGKTMLIDAGNNDKEKLVVDYLKKEKITKVDILIGTHPDADHIGGLDAVIDNFEIGKIYMPKAQSNTKTFEDVLTAIKNKGLKVTTAKAGLTLDWEQGAAVNMIAPVGEYDDDNDWSAVIHLTFGKTSFLFTGDAEAKSEQDMLKSNVSLKSDVLLVGHHGSKSSSSQAFLDAINPSYAVIQVGKNNNYGHPTSEVLKRLSDKGVKTFRADQQGTVIVTTNGTDINIETNSQPAASVPPSQMPTPTPTPTLSSAIKPSPAAPAKQEENVVYANCTQVKAAGKAPLHKGDPGYSTKLDRDKDGIACE